MAEILEPGLRRKLAPKRKRALRLLSSAEAVREVVARINGAEHKFVVSKLWQLWNVVMGDEIAAISSPLGERAMGKTGVLLVGAEDNMLLQELSFLAPEILARANSFMEREYFVKVQLELLQSRAPLYPYNGSAMPPPSVLKEERRKPEGFGALLEKGELDEDSPVGRCYASFVKSFV